MIISVEHKVPYEKGEETMCQYADGDFWGKSVCAYHVFRDITHGRKAPVERHKPKCSLFNQWLSSSYTKCDMCLQKCKEALKEE